MIYSYLGSFQRCICVNQPSRYSDCDFWQMLFLRTLALPDFLYFQTVFPGYRESVFLVFSLLTNIGCVSGKYWLWSVSGKYWLCELTTIGVVSGNYWLWVAQEWFVFAPPPLTLFDFLYLASPDAQEVMWVSQSVSQSVSDWWLADLTDVTLVSDDSFRRL